MRVYNYDWGMTKVFSKACLEGFLWVLYQMWRQDQVGCNRLKWSEHSSKLHSLECAVQYISFTLRRVILYWHWQVFYKYISKQDACHQWCKQCFCFMTWNLIHTSKECEDRLNIVKNCHICATCMCCSASHVFVKLPQWHQENFLWCGSILSFCGPTIHVVAVYSFTTAGSSDVLGYSVRGLRPMGHILHTRSLSPLFPRLRFYWRWLN